MYAGTFPIISAEEAASHIHDGAMAALSGFANAGTAKLVPQAIAKRVTLVLPARSPGCHRSYCICRRSKA